VCACHSLSTRDERRGGEEAKERKSERAAETATETSCLALTKIVPRETLANFPFAATAK